MKGGMGSSIIAQNERQAAEIEAELRRLSAALDSENIFRSLARGLPAEILPNIRRAIKQEVGERETALMAYEKAKGGDCRELFERAGSDLGLQLIAARICRGFSQKELARKLGLKEQAVQRWEAERYRSITLANFQMVATALGVRVQITDLGIKRLQLNPTYATPPEEASKVLRHAKKRHWIDGDDSERILIKRIGDHVLRHSTPSLLRTGLKVADNSLDWSLVAWKAQVTWIAEKVASKLPRQYSPLDLEWLPSLVKLSSEPDGISKVKSFLQDKGIVLVIEPQVPGMKIDGAAFLVDGVPVIGLTLLRDTVDNFWFTLLHEVAHVVLHYRTGLNAGFFDDMDESSLDEIELEADKFARNLLVPDEIWQKSAARISKDAEPIIRLAKKLEIAPEILFGRIRMERKNYSIFSGKIGQGQVRVKFPEYEGGSSRDFDQ